MRIIFLDIDGVLNSEAFLRKLDDQHRQLGHHEACECFRLERKIDRDAVARLNRLVAATDSKIVISSSWRLLLDPSELHRVLSEHGLVAEIIGETPDGDSDPEMLAIYGPSDRLYRGVEIDFWLKKHPEVDRFVILDDASDMAMHKNRLVQTDCEEGLLDEHVDLAIRVMSWDGKKIPGPFEAYTTRQRDVPGELRAALLEACDKLDSYIDGYDDNLHTDIARFLTIAACPPPNAAARPMRVFFDGLCFAARLRERIESDGAGNWTAIPDTRKPEDDVTALAYARGFFDALDKMATVDEDAYEVVATAIATVEGMAKLPVEET